MTERQPIEAVNIDESGNPGFEWSAVQAALDAPHGPEEAIFIGTVRPDGRPHVVGIGVSWIDGDLWITTGADSVKAANLAVNPHATLAGRIGAFDLSLEGVAEHITDASQLETMAARFQADGWPATVNGPYLEAPINDVTPVSRRWNLYRFRFTRVIAVGDGSTMSFRFAD